MRVFVSYRRSDSKDIAARIADNLKQVREINAVFFDVESIAHGEHFPERLQSEIEKANVIIAVIGPTWRGKHQEDGTFRIDNADDFVRREIASALAAEKRIIPVIVDGAEMLAARELPDEIAELANHNALTIRHAGFRVDFEILAEAILGKRRATGLAPAALAIGGAWRFGAGLIVAVILAIAVASIGMATMGVPLETILGGRAQLAVLLLLILALCQYWTFRFLRLNWA